MHFQPEDNYDTRIAKREKVKKKIAGLNKS